MTILTLCPAFISSWPIAIIGCVTLKLHNSQMREFLELWPDVPMAHKCGVRWNR